MKKIYVVANLLAFGIMILMNYLSNTGIIAGETMGSVSAKYDNLFTPAGYTFSIWGLIYLGLLGFSLFQAFRADKAQQLVGWWFFLSCCLNVAWIFAWLNEFLLLSVLIMIGLLISLIAVIFRSRMELDDEPLPIIGLIWWPFSLYSGWISVALIANVAAWLTSVQWGGWGLSNATWAIIMILIATGINIVITWTRNMREFALVGAWALVGIGVSNVGGDHNLSILAFCTAGVLVLSSGVHGYSNREHAPWKKI